MPSIYENFKAYREGEAIDREAANALERTDPLLYRKKVDNADLAILIIRTFYGKILNKLSDEKKAELAPALTEICISKATLKEHNKLKTLAQGSLKLTDEQREQHFYYQCPNSLIHSGAIEEMINEIEKHLSEEDKKEILDEMNNFVSPIHNNIPIHYFQKEIDAQKKKNESEITDPELRNAINSELDKINEVVLVSSTEYSDAHGDNINQIYDKMVEKKSIESGTAEIQKEKYQKYEARLTKSYYDSIVPEIKEEETSNLDLANEFCEDAVKIVVPEKNKEFLRKAINLMQKHGLINDADKGDEMRIGKAYAFWRIGEASNRLRDAIQSNNLDELRAAREEYEQRVADMREIFDLIKNELNPTEEMAIGNVNNFRDVWVPAEFKDNVIVNSYANAIYALMSVLNHSGQSVDDLLENPNETFIKIMQGTAEKISPARMNDMSPAQVITYLSGLNSSMEYPLYGIGRNINIFSPLTYDPSNPEQTGQNKVGIMLLSAYNSHVGFANTYNGKVSIFNYLSTNTNATLSNAMLVNEEDRDYNKLRGFDAISNDCMRKIPAFNPIEYMETHEIDPTKLLARLNSTVNEVVSSKKESVSIETKAITIQSAQLAALQYVMFNPVPPTGQSELDAYNSLLQMIKSPQIAFPSVFENPNLHDEFKNLDNINAIRSNIISQGKSHLKTDRETARAAEKNYNAAIDKLDKDINAIVSNISREEKNNPVNAELLNTLAARLAELTPQRDELQKNELARLEKDYLEGKMPKDYFDSRYSDVMSNNHHEKRPFGVSEYPSRKQFMSQFSAEIKNGTYTREDINELYDSKIESATREQNKYFMVKSTFVPRAYLPTEASYQKIEKQQAQEANAHIKNPPQQPKDKEKLFVIEEVGEEEVEDAIKKNDIDNEIFDDKQPISIDELKEDPSRDIVKNPIDAMDKEISQNKIP